MANDVNVFTGIGRMTRDAELKTIGNTSLCNFGIAVNKSFVSNGEKKEKVNFFECQVWGKLADILKQYGGKGKQICINGQLEQSTWDGQDGKKMSKVIIRVENFQLLGGKSQEAASEIASDMHEQAAVDYSQEPDDIF